MAWGRGRSSIFVVASALFLVTALSAFVLAQGLPQSPYSAPSMVRGGLGPAPSNPLAPPGLPRGPVGGPREMDSVFLTPQLFPGIFPSIPNLQVGYLYSFGEKVKADRLTVDYLFPVNLGPDSAFFAEAHGQFTNFWKSVERWFSTDGTITSFRSLNERKDLSLGAGIRKIFGGNTLVGLNGFYDGTKLGRKWYHSGSAGLEFAALLLDDDALDLNFNWYGNLFNANVLANAFRRGPANFDIQAGYSHELWDGGPDLRLSGTAYKFSARRGVTGGKGAAELKTRDGMFSVKYEVAYDDINRTYHSVGAFMNLAFGLDVSANWAQIHWGPPEPIFRSPRNFFRRLRQPVAKRRMTAPTVPIVMSRAITPSPVDPPASCGGLVPFGQGDDITFTPPVTPVTGFTISIPLPQGAVSWVDLNTPPCDNFFDVQIYMFIDVREGPPFVFQPLSARLVDQHTGVAADLTSGLEWGGPPLGSSNPTASDFELYLRAYGRPNSAFVDAAAAPTHIELTAVAPQVFYLHSVRASVQHGAFNQY